MDALLGFAVLTGPLWLIVLALLLGIGISVALPKRLKQKSAKFMSVIGVFLILFLLLFGDEIAGRIYLSHLCATQAGVKVYQTVELPKEYWDEEGIAKFYRNFNSLLGKSYSRKYKSEIYSSIFHIDKVGFVYSNKNSDQVLGEEIDFGHWGGWIRRNLTTDRSAKSCIDYSDPSNRLVDRIFIPEHSKSK
ncbi:hypothetical protein [Thiobacter aerophilum]|uniref:Uncharacterized protein n=1 Tax=Thiobacter aerophilum TaxID=3121275 RepID=A0ABV0EHE3_9BURK